MISIQSQVHLDNITGAELVDFFLHCTDREYQAWWRGTHLEFHTIKRYPNDLGNLVYMDEFVGKRRIKMIGIVTEVVPGRRIVWQFKKIIHLPVRLVLELEDDARGVALTHTIQAGFTRAGKLLDPLFRIYFSDEFSKAMDEHARLEFPKLRDMLHAPARF